MKRLMTCLVLAALCAVASIIVAGCETEPAVDGLVSITPISTELRNGGTQAFEASGASNYKWSLQKGSYGYLSALSGDRVVYTSTYAGGSSNVVTEVLTVAGNLYPAGTTGVFTAQASIIHLGNAN